MFNISCVEHQNNIENVKISKNETREIKKKKGKSQKLRIRPNIMMQKFQVSLILIVLLIRTW